MLPLEVPSLNAKEETVGCKSIVSDIPSLSSSKSQPFGAPSESVSKWSSNPGQISEVSGTPSPSESVGGGGVDPHNLPKDSS